MPSNSEGASLIGYLNVYWKLSFLIYFFCKSCELPQLHVESMLCYTGAAEENFCTCKEVEVISKKSVGAMLAQFGKGKDEQYSYGEYKTQ